LFEQEVDVTVSNIEPEREVGSWDARKPRADEDGEGGEGKREQWRRGERNDEQNEEHRMRNARITS